MTKKITPAEYDAWLEQDGRGYVALEPYAGAHAKIKHQCPVSENHQWSVRPADIKKGKGCRYCAIESKRKKQTLNSADYEAALLKDGRGYVALEPYVTAITKIKHQCPVSKDHQWSAKPNDIKGGGGCPHCDEITHADYENFLINDGRGYVALEPYAGALTKIKHQCPVSEDHQWDAPPSRIKSGAGCRYCAIESTKILLSSNSAEHEALLIKDGRGYVALEPYVNSRTKIKHQCPVSEDHKWESLPNNIKKGHGCPHCDPLGTDADVFYIWENADDQGVYKVGITSQRCNGDRLTQCANKNGMTANVILKLATPNAREIEREALKMGDAADYPSAIDGYTEFRRYTDKQLGDVHRMAVNFGR